MTADLDDEHREMLARFLARGGRIRRCPGFGDGPAPHDPTDGQGWRDGKEASFRRMLVNRQRKALAGRAKKGRLA